MIEGGEDFRVQCLSCLDVQRLPLRFDTTEGKESREILCAPLHIETTEGKDSREILCAPLHVETTTEGWPLEVLHASPREILFHGRRVRVHEVLPLLHPEPIESPLVNYVVLGLGILFEGASWAFALNEFRKTKGKWGYVEAVHRGKDPSMFVVIFEDSAALLGLMVALAGVALSQWTGILLFDGIASVIIGLLLGGTANASSIASPCCRAGQLSAWAKAAKSALLGAKVLVSCWKPPMAIRKNPLLVSLLRVRRRRKWGAFGDPLELG